MERHFYGFRVVVYAEGGEAIMASFVG